ncbi:P-loop containing nucleoside triphosphate hydrolase protein [Amanita muscaria]
MKLTSSSTSFKQAFTSKSIRIASKCTQRFAHASSLAAADVLHAPLQNSVSFEELGLHPPIVTALRRAFRNVIHPTESQAQFIPAVLSGKDVLLRDLTGSGKSFGLAVALLNKPRLRAKVTREGRTNEHHYITSLVLVPHRDLAYQYMHWIERIVSCAAVDPPPDLESVVQILVRDGSTHLTEGLGRLQENLPHILIGTPQAVMDVWHKDRNVLQLQRLSTVVVDEADYLVETLPRKDPHKSFRPGVIRAAKKLLAHPGVTRELLDMIYAKRRELSEEHRDEPGLVQHQRRIGLKETPSNAQHLPQLVMCSATLRGHLRTHLFQESGWLNKDNAVIFKGANAAPTTKSKKINVVGGTGVTHSVLVVSEESIVNIKGAVSGTEAARDQALTPELIFGTAEDPEALDLDKDVAGRYEKTPSPFNPNALEAIATAFAVDVPRVGLLVLPASASIQRAIYELREMGVNAHGLDMVKDEKGKKHLLQLERNASEAEENPTLLVSTLATTRGIDLPELSHVFILGIPEGPKVCGRGVDGYLQMAGRVGRFGRGGKVITVIEASEEAKMERILNTISVVPVRFSYFGPE